MLEDKPLVGEHLSDSMRKQKEAWNMRGASSKISGY